MKQETARGRGPVAYAVKAMKSSHRPRVFSGKISGGLAVSAWIVACLSGCGSVPQESRRRVEETLAEHGAKSDAPLAVRPDESEARGAVARLLREPLTPDRAASIALVNNRRLRASLAAASYAEADLWQAARLPNPDISGSWRFPAGGGAVSSTVAVGFDVLDGFLIPLRKKLATEALDAAERRAADDALVVIAQTHAAWHTYAARREWQACLARLHGEDEARAEAVTRGPIAIAQARAQAGESAAELARLDAQLASDRERLNVLLGLEGPAATSWMAASGELAVPANRPNSEALERIALQCRLDLAAARADVALVDHAYELKRKTRYWPLGVEVGVESEREHTGERLTGPTLKVGLPIFDQGQAEMLRLQTARQQAKDREAALRIEICAEVRSCAASVEAIRRAEATMRGIALPQARRVWTENLRQAGTGPLALRNARRGLEEAERQAIEARRDYWLARTNLARALGGAGPHG